jgi:putative endonuclease
MRSERSQELGRAGERLVALEYNSKGYTIVARNWRCPSGEIDLVVSRGNELVFCEVKTRSSLVAGLPEEAVSLSKQKKIRDLAATFISSERAEGSLAGSVDVRFDVASVILASNRPPEVVVFEDAF